MKELIEYKNELIQLIPIMVVGMMLQVAGLFLMYQYFTQERKRLQGQIDWMVENMDDLNSDIVKLKKDSHPPADIRAEVEKIFTDILHFNQ